MSYLYSVTSVEGHGLWVSKNTVVKDFIDLGCVRTGHRRVFEPKTEQMAGGCRKLHNLYCL